MDDERDVLSLEIVIHFGIGPTNYLLCSSGAINYLSKIHYFSYGNNIHLPRLVHNKNSIISKDEPIQIVIYIYTHTHMEMSQGHSLYKLS
jgi:hypothetical protein